MQVMACRDSELSICSPDCSCKFRHYKPVGRLNTWSHCPPLLTHSVPRTPMSELLLYLKPRKRWVHLQSTGSFIVGPTERIESEDPGCAHELSRRHTSRRIGIVTLEVSHPNNTDTDFRKPFQPFICHVLLRPPSHVLMFIASARHIVVFRIPDTFA